MKGKKLYGIRKRITAGFLAITMCCSLFTGMSFTSYAAELSGGGSLSDGINLEESTNAGDETSEGESTDDVTKDPEDASGEIGNDDTDEGNDDNDNDINDDVNNDNDDADNDNDDVNNENDDNDSESIDNDENDMEQDSEDEEADLEAEDEIIDLESEGIPREEYGFDFETYSLDSDLIEKISNEQQLVLGGKTVYYLTIQENLLPEGGKITPEIVEDVIEYFGNRLYSNITLGIISEDNNQINKELYNVCISHLLNDPSAQIGYLFYDATNYDIEYYFDFYNPKELDNDIDANTYFEVEGSDVYFNLPKENAYVGYSDRVLIHFRGKKVEHIADAMNTKFGKGRYCFYNTASENGYTYVEWNRFNNEYDLMEISNAEELTGIKYKIDEVPPSAYEEHANTSGSYISLTIEPLNHYEYKDGEVKNILEQFHNGKKYDSITVRTMTIDESDWIITSDVYNAVIPYLKDGCEIHYYGYIASENVYWNFQNPSEISADSSPAANMSVIDGKAAVQMKGISNFDAESISMSKSLKSDINTKFASILGDSGQSSLFEGDNETPVEGAYVEWKKDAGLYWVYIYGVENLKEDVTYTIGKAALSAFEEYTNGDYTSLTIEISDKDEYKDGKVEGILEIFHSGKKYDGIFVRILGDNCDWIITPDVYNAVIPYLKDGGEIQYSGIVAGKYNYWHFQNPSIIEEECSPTATLSVTDGKAAVQMKGIENINAESIRTYQSLTGDIKTQFDNILGDSGRLSLFAENSETPVEGAYVKWTKERSNVDIYGVEILKEDVIYTIGEYTYRGDVYEYGDGKKELFIESSALKKDKFSQEDLTSIINWYAGKGEKFDRVALEEKYSTNNLIKKDYFNLAASILKDESSSLGFGFHCKEENGYYNLYWNFSSCGQGINKDINGNVTITAAENYGVTFQLNAANTYPSGNTDVMFYIWADTSLSGQVKAALGEPDSTENGVQLAVLKGTTAATDLQVSYTGAGKNMWLSALDVSKWAAKTNYTITPVHETAGFNVGESISLTEISGKLDYPEGAADPKWTSLTTDLISVADGKLSALDGGDGYVLLSYKSGKNSCLRLYRIPISKRITRIAMDKELTMDLEYGTDEVGYKNCTEELELKVYPADAGCDIYDPKEIRWETGKEDVVEIVTDDNGRFMYIRALKPGEAVITASYIGNLEEGAEPTIKASCKVTVRAPIKIENIPGEKDELYAVTNFDTALFAVELPIGWEWADKNTALSPFVGMESSIFPAVYTDAESGRTETHNLKVRMITVTGIRILQVYYEENNEEDNKENIEKTKEPELFIAKDSKQTVTYATELLFASGSPMNEDEWNALSKKWEKAGYTTVWSSNPKNLGAVSIDNPSRWQFTVDSNTAKGKKTITAAIQNSKNKKVFSASHSVTVTENPVVDFPASVIDVSDLTEDGMFTNVYDENTDTGRLTIAIPSEKYSSGKLKLTVTSKDTAVLKIGKISEIKGSAYVITTVPYERKGYGIAPVVITASDERKSSCTLRFTFVDTTPKLLTQTVTLNKKMTDKSADILIQCEKGYTVAGDVSVGADYSGIFNIECVKGAAGATSTTGSPDTLKISLKNDSVKKGKYKVNITVPIKAEAADNNADADTAADAAAVDKVLTVTVSVVETIPSVTVKQTKKVNTFYKDAEGYGMLSITANGAKVKEVSLDACDYELAVSDTDGVYVVKPKASAAGKVKKGTLSYKLEGYDATYTKSVTIGTANTKPVIVLSQKSDTLYSGAGYRKTTLVLTEKSTGNTVSADDILVKDAEDKNYKKLSPNVTIKGSGKNYYQISGGANGLLDIQLAADKKINSGTDKIPLRIQKPNWNSSIDVTYSVKVNTKAPKLKLSKATVTLNKNDGVYGYQQAETNLSLNGCSAILKNGNADVRVYFTGKDTASTNALKVDGNLVLQYKEEQGCITARFNDNELRTGNYKYNVCVEIKPDEGEVIKASTALTVKVVDSNPEKCISVSTKGSIDLLDREGTGIAVTPKLSNVTGSVTGGWLTDKDAGLFESDFEDGKLYIRAKDGKYYSTKHTYKVKAVFWVKTEDYHSYKLVSKELSFKVKQGKPKIKVSSETANTLYRTTGNEIELKIEALLGTKAVEIEEVYLVNFTDDLALVESKAKTGQNYDSERHSVRIKATGATKNIMQNGKTQTVKLAVRYRDKAGDVKDTQITYKICVK